MAGREADLTPTEYELLRVRSLNEGRVGPSMPFLHQVWSGREASNVDLVRNIAKKLREDARNPAWISNMRGVGYRMARPNGG